ncbi:hypothetical protein GCM10010455_06910 [Microbacterium esteraromaticum]
MAHLVLETSRRQTGRLWATWFRREPTVTREGGLRLERPALRNDPLRDCMQSLERTHRQFSNGSLEN